MSARRPIWTETPEAGLDASFAALAAGARDRRLPLHLASLATIGDDGRPRLRIVVLRGADRATRSLRFHTDGRSDKAGEIAREPRVALSFYDPAAALQIRIEGHATLHADDAVADEAWAAAQAMSRVCYGVSPGPGTPLAAPDDFALPADPAAIAAGREHFRAVMVRIATLEWVHLAAAGHRRARCDLTTGRIEGVWLSP